MLMITSFANPRVAQAFVDYMATQGVILTIQQHNQSDVWLADESQAERVRAELARFLENPADPRYLAASWQAGHTGSGLHYRRYPFFAALRERAGPVTWVMMIACVVVFIAMQILGDQEVVWRLIGRGLCADGLRLATWRTRSAKWHLPATWVNYLCADLDCRRMV